MKKIAAIVFFYALLSCGESINTENQLQPSPDSTKFYPIASFFKDQIDIIPAMKKEMILFSTSANKKDSTLLTTSVFKKLVQEFISKDITDATTKKHYRETVFQDASTGSYTLSYTAVDTTVTVKGMDVLLDERTNAVQRVFIRSMYRKDDSSIMEQHNWNSSKGFQIIRSTTNSQGYTSTNITEVKWNE